MTRAETIAKLRQSLTKSSARQVNWDVITEDTPIETLGFDSLSILDLIYDLQQDFGLEFEPEELAGVRSVGNLVDFLVKKTG
jgi:acyl carrier protein